MKLVQISLAALIGFGLSIAHAGQVDVSCQGESNKVSTKSESLLPGAQPTPKPSSVPGGGNQGGSGKAAE